MRPTIPLLAFALAASALGCQTAAAPTSANFTKALDAYYLEHTDCLFDTPPRYPVEVTPNTDPALAKQMQALASAQFLDGEKAPALKAVIYKLSATGTKYGPRFCYGHRQVTTIDSNTPPALANGFNESKVSFHYVMKEIPIWADSDSLKAAFPKLASETSGQASDSITLAATPVGWQVPQ